MLSRSISILRTTLVDHSVAMPVFKFLKHPDVDVQVAATAAICNLVLEASPVRELLAENGVMKILCEHAHSDNPALRLNALWALKHLVIAVSSDLKRSCLEQLDPDWLVQLICDDGQGAISYNTQPGQPSGDDVDVDVDEEMDASPSDEQVTPERKTSSPACVKMSSTPQRRSRNDEVAVQEQEMIDYLFRTIGQDRLFDLLSSKLQAKVLHPFSRRTTTPGQETRLIHPHAKIIIPVIYILVHIAASTHQHRQLVARQTDLLKLLYQQIGNRDKEVRVAVCHFIINLTGHDDESLQEWSMRANELKKLGFHTRMEFLKHNDRDLDNGESPWLNAWKELHERKRREEANGGAIEFEVGDEDDPALLSSLSSLSSARVDDQNGDGDEDGNGYIIVGSEAEVEHETARDSDDKIEGGNEDGDATMMTGGNENEHETAAGSGLAGGDETGNQT
ncbi:hypothetical protein MKX08_008285 [Trichoderma sp. CBMAI-0020]|nr:hypothetical protein MKX08_008285 [Trichoderma sp. CBMAI-0020]